MISKSKGCPKFWLLLQMKRKSNVPDISSLFTHFSISVCLTMNVTSFVSTSLSSTHFSPAMQGEQVLSIHFFLSAAYFHAVLSSLRKCSFLPCPCLSKPDFDFGGNVSSLGTQGCLCVMSFLVPLSHSDKTFGKVKHLS